MWYNKHMSQSQLVQQLGIMPLTAQLLQERGITDVEAARRFLFPAVENLCPLERYKGLKEVAERIMQAVEQGQKVVVYGDYDCDGICATAILYMWLTEHGAECSYYIPDRHTEGYGINMQALEMIAESEYPDLIISVDCGITGVEEVRFAQEELGIDIVITDHHEPPEIIPDCPVFDPKLSGEDAFRDLCGAGVALRIVEYLSGIEESKRYYDIACLATIADVVPLKEDNRVIASCGLKLLNLKRRKGLKLLIESCISGSVTSYDVAFRLAPRINATGRIETAAQTVSLFYETDVFLLDMLIKNINECNEKRRLLTSDLTQACIEKLSNKDLEDVRIIVLYDPYWDDGVLGITASRLVELYNRPVILITDSSASCEAKGSGRSVEGIDILDCVSKASSYLIRYGGHKRACGVTLDRKLVSQFEYVINSYCKLAYPDFRPQFVQAEEYRPLPVPCDVRLVKELEMLQPYGEGNPKPGFYSDRTRCSFTRIGNGQHVKESVNECETLGFSLGEKLQWLNSMSPKRMSGRLDYKIFNNIERAEFTLNGVVPLGKPPRQLLTTSYLCINAGGGERSVFRPCTCDEGSVIKETCDRNTGYCILVMSEEGARRAEKISSGKWLSVYGRPLTPCPYNTLLYAPVRGADLSGYSHVILAEKPLLEGCIDELILNKDCKVSYFDGYPEEIRGNIPDYNALAEIYKAIRRALPEGKSVLSEVALYNAAGKEFGYEKFIAALFTFVDLGIIIYNASEGYSLDTSVRRALTDSKLYAKMQEVDNG